MTPEAATALRKPFAPNVVGKLPKPMYKDSKKGNCPECHGYHGMPAVHLDYVGHAAVTDRLLTIDPEWSWEPLAVDEVGLPALDRRGNLWIRLTIAGTTRIGVGDGGSAKECIGDAVRNAAMRFGVALDLWSKEELEQAHGPAQRAPQASGAGVAPDPAASVSEPESAPAPDLTMTDNTRGGLFAMFTELGMTDENLQREFLTDTLDRPVESRASLTEPEGDRAAKRLRAIKRGDARAAWTPSEAKP